MEFSRADSPRTSRSMFTAIEDLDLERLFVVNTDNGRRSHRIHAHGERASSGRATSIGPNASIATSGVAAIRSQ